MVVLPPMFVLVLLHEPLFGGQLQVTLHEFEFGAQLQVRVVLFMVGGFTIVAVTLNVSLAVSPAVANSNETKSRDTIAPSTNLMFLSITRICLKSPFYI